MYNFAFQNTTKVYFGMDNFVHLKDVCRGFGQRVLMVYGGGSVKRTGLYDRVMAQLQDGGMEVFELGGVEPNPRHTTVNKGAKLCREHHIDVVLAVGGGSTIDCSKGICATALSETENVWDLVERKVPYDKALPLVTIVTIAATGSEMDTGAVISNMDLNIKSGIMSEVLRPAVTFEVPEFTFSVPKYQTACGSVDIMSHLFDVSYFSAQEEMSMVKGMEEELLRTVVRFAPVACREPDNYEARANLMWAASWALNDFLTSGVRQMTVCHMLEHELSAFYDITHGHGLAILIPRWLRYVLNDETAKDIYRFGVNVMGVAAGLADREGALRSIDALERFFFETLELAPTLTALGITDKDFETMADRVTAWGPIQSFTTLTKEDVLNIYRMCL